MYRGILSGISISVWGMGEASFADESGRESVAYFLLLSKG
jgi:hypothetical protein